MPGIRSRGHRQQAVAGPTVGHVFYVDGEKDGTGVIKVALRQLPTLLT